MAARGWSMRPGSTAIWLDVRSRIYRDTNVSQPPVQASQSIPYWCGSLTSSFHFTSGSFTEAISAAFRFLTETDRRGVCWPPACWAQRRCCRSARRWRCCSGRVQSEPDSLRRSRQRGTSDGLTPAGGHRGWAGSESRWGSPLEPGEQNLFHRLASALFINYSFYYLVGSEVDLIDLCKNLEGGPGQSGEQVAREQQNLKTEKTEDWCGAFPSRWLLIATGSSCLSCGRLLPVKQQVVWAGSELCTTQITSFHLRKLPLNGRNLTKTDSLQFLRYFPSYWKQSLFVCVIRLQNHLGSQTLTRSLMSLFSMFSVSLIQKPFAHTSIF